MIILFLLDAIPKSVSGGGEMGENIFRVTTSWQLVFLHITYVFMFFVDAFKIFSLIHTKKVFPFFCVCCFSKSFFLVIKTEFTIF